MGPRRASARKVSTLSHAIGWVVSDESANQDTELTQDHSGRKPATEGGTFCETETRNAICLAFLNACDSAVAPLDDLAQLAELDLNGQRRDR